MLEAAPKIGPEPQGNAMSDDGAATIKGLIEASGKSYREVAGDCGVSLGTISNWVNKGRVTPGNYEAFAEAVDVPTQTVRTISGAGGPGRMPGTDGDLIEWMQAAYCYSDDPYLNAVIEALLLFRDAESGLATVTIEEIDQRTPLRADMIAERWEDVLACPLVERVSSEAVEARGVWVLRLVMPY